MQLGTRVQVKDNTPLSGVEHIPIGGLIGTVISEGDIIEQGVSWSLVQFDEDQDTTVQDEAAQYPFADGPWYVKDEDLKELVSA